MSNASQKPVKDAVATTTLDDKIGHPKAKEETVFTTTSLSPEESDDSSPTSDEPQAPLTPATTVPDDEIVAPNASEITVPVTNPRPADSDHGSLCGSADAPASSGDTSVIGLTDKFDGPKAKDESEPVTVPSTLKRDSVVSAGEDDVKESPKNTAAATAFGDEATSSNTKETTASDPAAARRTPKRRRDASPGPDTSEIPEEAIRKSQRHRTGGRSSTRYSPSPSPCVPTGARSVTPNSGLRRWPSRSGSESPVSSSSLSSSPDKENVSFVRSDAPSPSPKKKAKFAVRDRSSSRTSSVDESFTFGVPANTPWSLSRTSSYSDASSRISATGPTTPPPLLERAIHRFFEVEVVRKMKELTESPLADVTEAYTVKEEPLFDVESILCPPNTPNADRVGGNW